MANTNVIMTISWDSDFGDRSEKLIRLKDGELQTKFGGRYPDRGYSKAYFGHIPQLHDAMRKVLEAYEAGAEYTEGD